MKFVLDAPSAKQHQQCQKGILMKKLIRQHLLTKHFMRQQKK